MRSKRSHFARFGVLALALTATVGFTVGTAEAKKKKLRTFEQQVAVNAPIPNALANLTSTPLVSTIVVGKKYRNRTVADVNVTNLQTSGTAADAADDLNGALTAPNGRTILLFDNVGDISLGPWTMDDDTNVSICDETPGMGFCNSPLRTLYRPFAGTSNLKDSDDDVGVLSEFDGVRMRGTWTLTVWEDTVDPRSSVFNQWGLQIRPLTLKPPTVQVG